VRSKRLEDVGLAGAGRPVAVVRLPGEVGFDADDAPEPMGHLDDRLGERAPVDPSGELDDPTLDGDFERAFSGVSGPTAATLRVITSPTFMVSPSSD
jgi:hypothetical protein